jgi:hypothetical protein
VSQQGVGASRLAQHLNGVEECLFCPLCLCGSGRPVSLGRGGVRTWLDEKARRNAKVGKMHRAALLVRPGITPWRAPSMPKTSAYQGASHVGCCCSQGSTHSGLNLRSGRLRHLHVGPQLLVFCQDLQEAWLARRFVDTRCRHVRYAGWSVAGHIIQVLAAGLCTVICGC